MEKVKKRVPELRFKGFSGDWEQRKLGEFFSQTSNYINPNDEGLDLWSLTVERGLTPKTDRYNRTFLVKKDNQFKRVDNGEFLYNPMNMTLGAVDQNKTGKSVAVSGYYTTMVLSSGLGTDFFRVMLRSPQLIHKYKQFATGSLIERQRVQFPTFSIISVIVPKANEQNIISKLFCKLDSVIALHERKIELLKSLKTAYLQQLFVKNGQNIPQLRFTGFSDDWEQRKLGEIVKIKITNGLMNKPGRNKLNALDINVVNMYTPDFVHINELDYFDATISELRKCNVEIGDIFVTRSSLKAEGIAESNVLLDEGVFVFDDHLMRLKLKNKYVPYFVKELLRTYDVKKQFVSKAKTATMTTIGQQDISNTVALLPEEAEQLRISNLVQSINNIIALHERMSNNLRTIKQAYLQKLFV